MTFAPDPRIAVHRALDHHVSLGSVSAWTFRAWSPDPTVKQFIIRLAGSTIHQTDCAYTLREAEVLCEGLAAADVAARRRAESLSVSGVV